MATVKDSSIIIYTLHLVAKLYVQVLKRNRYHSSILLTDYSVALTKLFLKLFFMYMCLNAISTNNTKWSTQSEEFATRAQR